MKRDLLWLRPYEFHIVQRLRFSGDIWSIDEIVADLAERIRNNIAAGLLNQDLVKREIGGICNVYGGCDNADFLYRRLKELAMRFIINCLSPEQTVFRGTIHNDRREAEAGRRLGRERIIWERRGPYGSKTRFFSINSQNKRVEEGMVSFPFKGLRSGSRLHRSLVEDYAILLEVKDCFVSVDRGDVESALPDIMVWSPVSLFRWRRAGCVEVEVDAYRKSEEAILHNFMKNRHVRFAVYDEMDAKRITQVLEGSNVRTVTVQNAPVNFTGNRGAPSSPSSLALAEIEVLNTDTPYAHYLVSLGPSSPAERIRAARLGSDDDSYSKIYNASEIRQMKKQEEERRRHVEWEKAWALAEEGDRSLLNKLRWEDIKNGPRAKLQEKIREEDERWLEREHERINKRFNEGAHGRIRLIRRRYKPITDGSYIE